MATSPLPARTGTWWSTPPGLLLLVAILSTLPAWWLVAWPVLSLENAARHATHLSLVYGHVLGGSVMLVLGALNLYIGATRHGLRFHRYVGYGYLVGGGFGAGSALVLALALLIDQLRPGKGTLELQALGHSLEKSNLK